MNRLTSFFCTLFLFCCASLTLAQKPTITQPNITIQGGRAEDNPILITHHETLLHENAAFKRVRATFVFTNPNPRQMAGTFEFPLPNEAFVCGYALEIQGIMVQGVVCEKKTARVAFENETRKGVDPGLVEQLQGNIWRTRIFPLLPNTPRKASVDYIAPKTLDTPPPTAILEQDGDDFFLASAREAPPAQSISERIATFTEGVILWDASLSAQSFATEWRNQLAALPENGNWTLVTFRHQPDAPRTFTQRDALLSALEATCYDGGTNIGAALHSHPLDKPLLLFTDEMDTLGLTPPALEVNPNLLIASRKDPPHYNVVITKLSAEEAAKTQLTPSQSTLLATVWAARQMLNFASQAEQRKAEFAELGRRYGVAGPGFSLIVLETLEQWLEYQIEPPQALPLHAEWLKRRAAMDDPILAKKRQAEHEQRLLHYWEERVTWWNNPKPPKRTPSSGLFDHMTAHNTDDETEGVEAAEAITPSTAPITQSNEHNRRNMGLRGRPIGRYGAAASRVAQKRTAEGVSASMAAVTLRPWDPKTPYLDALNAASADEAYMIYLQQREQYADSPAFYLDCAGWFFTHNNPQLAERIITNLAEFKLENAALWRTMGWRLREAGRYSLAIHCFRKVLQLRKEEGQAFYDLALILSEAAKESLKQGVSTEAVHHLEAALQYYCDAAFKPHQRESGRSSNDFQVAIIALEELNGLISWIEAYPWQAGEKPKIPDFDPVYRRDLPVNLRIVMRWDADATDIDLHVREPNGEEAYYGHRRTSEGGFVSEDVTTGYGPEEYLCKEAASGLYTILTNYFASHQTELTGATTVSVTIYTHWGTPDEKQRLLTLRLNRPQEKYVLGEVAF